ncbi:MAG: hypothetical protein LUG24_03955 [Clostridiales bacterium]|nr:hypothetical protein [Clostridiales bacterium]
MLWLVTALGYLLVGVCVILIPILMYIVCHFAKLLSGLLWYVKTRYGEDFSIDDIDEFVKEKEAAEGKNY